MGKIDSTLFVKYKHDNLIIIQKYILIIFYLVILISFYERNFKIINI